MFDTLLDSTTRGISRMNAKVADRLLEKLVPTRTAKAGFGWVRKCRSILIVACPAGGDHEWCDVYCEFHDGTQTCYWHTATNCSQGCGPC